MQPDMKKYPAYTSEYVCKEPLGFGKNMRMFFFCYFSISNSDFTRNDEMMS